MHDELLDLVSDQDQIIGQMLKSEVYLLNKNNFRVVNAFIINDLGQFWIPRRTKEKKLFPLCLDASMGGHVMAGESYQQAFERELLEELNMKVSDFYWQMVGYLTPQGHQTSAFMQLYIVHSQNVANYNKQDFCEYFWLYPHEIITRLQKNDKGKGDLIRMLQYLIDHKIVR